MTRKHEEIITAIHCEIRLNEVGPRTRQHGIRIYLNIETEE